MVLVAGSTGLLGNEICQQLTQKKTPVRALVRATSDAAKIAHLKSLGCEIAVGDLKDPASLAKACQGVKAVISTASSTFSRQEGDSIETVDKEGQLNLVDAAQKAGVEQFILVSFPDTSAYPNPLNDAKRAVEHHLQESGMNYVSLQANYFMEVWLSPALGFDFANRTVRVFGEGNNPSNLVSYIDVAQAAVACLDHPTVRNRMIPVGGPESLTHREVIGIFEKVAGTDFAVEQIPQAALEQQRAGAESPLDKSFSSLTLALAKGLPMKMEPIARELNLTLASVEDYAHKVLGK
jgi:uncharacterized protein YbjT (DUF2867 family)